MSAQEHYDVIVVGMGICGSALTHALAGKGKRVLSFERDMSMPDKIIGELLQPGGVASLKKLGLEDCLEGIDSPQILGYAVFPPGETPVALPYPKQRGERPRGRSFHHGRLIHNLRNRAKETATVQEATVRKLIEDEAGRVIGVEWRQRNGTKGKSYADFVFVCDGLLSNLRENFTGDEVDSTSKFVGMVMKNASAKLPYANHGHVFLIDPTPTLIYPISDSGDVRVLVDIPEPTPKGREEMQEYLRTVTAPQLPESVRELFLTAVDTESAFRSMPCGILHSQPLRRRGAMLLGDSLNVRHPLTGGGMTVAFNDVVLMSEALGKVEDMRNDKAIDRALVKFFSERKQVAAQINILAEALYRVFSNPLLRKACVDYFLLGGEAVDGPMALLGGMTPSPTLLIAHFFAVAFNGTFNWLKYPWPSNIRNASDTLTSATGIIMPLINGEHVLDTTFPRNLTMGRAKL